MRFRLLLALALSSVLSGCQTFGHIQFVVPDTHRPELLQALGRLAASAGMSDRIAESLVPETLAYFVEGDLSYTALGARIHEGVVVIDLVFRSAGIGGDRFREIKPRVVEELRAIYGADLAIEEDHGRMVPIPVPPNTSLERTREG